MLCIGKHETFAEKFTARLLEGIAALQKTFHRFRCDGPPAASGDFRKADLETAHIAPPEKENAVRTFRRKRLSVRFGNRFIMAHESRIKPECKSRFLFGIIVAFQNAADEIRYGGEHDFHLCVLLRHAAVDVRNLLADLLNCFAEIQRGAVRMEF